MKSRVNPVYVYTVLACIILCLLLLNRRGCKKVEGPAPTTDSVAYWRDKYGNEHMKVAQLTFEKTQLVDSISKVLKIKPKQVTKYVKTGIRVDTVVRPVVTTVIEKDPVTGRVDTVFDLNYVDRGYIHVQANKHEITVGVYAEINVTDYWKRKHRFLGISYGQKVKYTDIGTDNPYVHLVNPTSVTIEKKKWRLAPGIGVGFNYDPLTNQVHPGVQLGVYLTRSR